MKKKIFLLLVFILLLSGCGKDSKISEITLKGNTNADLTWSYVIEDYSIVGIDSEKYSGAESKSEDDYFGGTYTFYVNGKKEGTTKIKFNFGQSWNKKFNYSYIVTFSVDKDLNVKKEKEEGSYLALLKVINNIDKLDLNKDMDDYEITFEEDKKEVNKEKCYLGKIKDLSDNDKILEIAVSEDNIYIKEDNNYKKIK